MDKNELWRLIQKTEKRNDRRKLKRFIITVLFYAVAFLAIEYVRSDLSLLELAGEFVACLVLAIPFVLVNLVIFGQLIKASQQEDHALEFLRKMLEEKEREEKRKQKKLNQ
jgi:choline-glycine betaine transporter